MSLTSQTNNTYVTSIQSPTDTITNAIGLNDIDSIRRNLGNVQSMVNFDTKTILTNVIAKFDKSPIEVIDPINFTNLATAVGASFGGLAGSGTSIRNGLTAVNVFSNLSTKGGVIQFVANSTVVAGFDSSGSFYYDTLGRGVPKFDINGTFMTNSFILKPPINVNVSSYSLRATASTGIAEWALPDNIFNSTLRERIAFTGNEDWQQGFQFETISSATGETTNILALLDKNGNFTLGNPNYQLNADMKASNSVLLTSNIRFQKAGRKVGDFLQVVNIYGDLDFVSPTTTNVFLASQISCNQATSIVTQQESISFAVNSREIARFNSNGFLGLDNQQPEAMLDNCNTTILRSTLRYKPFASATIPFSLLTCVNENGAAEWKQLSVIGDNKSNSISLNETGTPITFTVNGNKTLLFSTSSNIIAQSENSQMNFDVKGVVRAEEYRGFGNIRFTDVAGKRLATLTDGGFFGINTEAPSQALTVNGGGLIQGPLTVTSNIISSRDVTAVSFIGDGSRVLNVIPTNVGQGSNNLAFFYSDSRAKEFAQIQQTVNNFSTLSSQISISMANGGFVNSETRIILSSQILATFITLSTSARLNETILENQATTISNTLSTNGAIANQEISTIIRANFSTLSTQTSFALSNTTSFLQGIINANVFLLSTNISTTLASSLTNTSTSIAQLSTLIGPGYQTVSSATYKYIDEQVSVARTDTTATVSVIIRTLRTGLNAQQFVIGSELPNPRALSNYTTQLDVSGNSIFGASSRIFIGKGGGLTVGHRTLQDSSGSIDTDGAVFASSFSGHKNLTFKLANKVVGEFLSSGKLRIGTAVTSMLNQNSLDVSGNIELTGTILKNGKPYSLTPILDLYWGRNGSNVFLLNGRVGIGTSEPNYDLDVMGSIRCRSLTVMGMNLSGLSSTVGSIINANASWSTSGAKIYYTGGPVGIGAGNINPLFTLDVSGIAVFKNQTSYFSSIGVGLPPNSETAGTIDVSGTIYADAFAGGSRKPFRFLRDNKEVARFGNDGRFMIGLSTQTQQGTGVDVSGNINITGRLFKNGVEVDIGNSWARSGGSNLVYTAGRIGIGTNSPQNTLDVAGTIRCQAIQIVKVVDTGGGTTSAGVELETTVFYMESTTRNAFYADKGNVGIGTSTPSARLHVIGDILTTGNLTTNRIITENLGFKSLVGPAGNNVTFQTSIGTGFSTNTSLIALSTGAIIIGPGSTRWNSTTPLNANITLAEGAQLAGSFVDIRSETIPSDDVITFRTTVNEFIYTLPPNTVGMDIYAWGAGGGSMVTSLTSASVGGGGACIKASRIGFQYEQYRVTVGTAGTLGSSLTSKPSRGGGLTKLEVFQNNQWKTLIIAGSGGGAGLTATGGAGTATGIGFQGGNVNRTTESGILPGQNVLGNPNGGGGGLSSGGSGGNLQSGPLAFSGSSETGGLWNSSQSTGAAGGAGFFGGGGAVSPGAGGGGSSFVSVADFNSIEYFNGSVNNAGLQESIYRQEAGSGGSFTINSGNGSIVFVLKYATKTEPILTIREGLSTIGKTYLLMDRSGNLNLGGSIRTSSILTSSVNGYPAMPIFSGWSDNLVQGSLSAEPRVVCSTSVNVTNSSFLLAMGNFNISNTIPFVPNSVPLTAFSYITMLRAGLEITSSRSSIIALPAGQASAIGLNHRVFVGPGQYNVLGWSYGNSALSTINTDITGLAGLF